MRREIPENLRERLLSGRYLPTLVEEDGVFHARWIPPEIDSYARSVGRGPLECGEENHYTVEDAWLAALRSDSDVVKWADTNQLRDLVKKLSNWTKSLALSKDDRAALTFELKAPNNNIEGEEWILGPMKTPRTRAGLTALGQAISICPLLRKRSLSLNEAVEFATELSIKLEHCGFKVKYPKGLKGEHITAEAIIDDAKIGGRVKRIDANKVEAKLTIRVDGEEVDENELKYLLDQNSSLVFFRDRWIEVDRFTLREAYKALVETNGKRTRRNDALSLVMGLGRLGRLRVTSAKVKGWLKRLLNELGDGNRFKPLALKSDFKGKLFDYQARGAGYMAFLANHGFGILLADDMGLGKTIQTIAWLNSRHDPAFRTLVVAPVSVTANWIRELNRFVPNLKTYLHLGPNRAFDSEFERKARRADVTVTGYSLLVKDFEMLRRFGYTALVLDEAQAIKNPATRVAHAAMFLDTPIRVALTGTPVENSARDIWSIEEFLNPGLLGDWRDFKDVPTFKMRKVLEPFMLRRLKTDRDVAAVLGPKREIREYCTLTETQRYDYEEALDSFRREVRAGGGRSASVLALLTRLKLICNGDCKLARLDDLLESIFDTGESALIFTQYAKTGAIIKRHLEERFQREFPFLHGALTPNAREREIKAFNEAKTPNGFILSLRAGGFGLNLTRATHVIHFDRWWNPAVENQATDRAHRIGQKSTVFVHLMITIGTLEDHIDSILESKRILAEELITSGEKFLLSMSDEDFNRVVNLEGEEHV